MNTAIKDKISLTLGNIKTKIQDSYFKYKSNRSIHLYNEAIHSEEKGDLEKSVKLYRKLLADEPEHIHAMEKLARVYSALNERGKAIRLFTTLTEHLPNEETFYLLGAEHFKQNRMKKAIKSLIQSLYYNKRYINSHLLLASVFERIGLTDKVEQYLSNAVKIDPTHRTALSELLHFYYYKERYRDALTVAEKYMKSYPDDLKISLLHAEILAHAGHYAKSLKELILLSEENTSFTDFIYKMDEFARVNPTARTREFLSRIARVKEERLLDFKSNLMNYYNNPDETDPPLPREALDLSFLFLFEGNNKKALTYLWLAKQLNNESKFL